MQGLMQDWSLTVPRIIDHAAEWHGEREIVSRTIEGGTHRYTYADLYRRTRRLAQALDRLGMRPGDRIGTLAWNGFRHLEAYFATAGTGTVLHTINPRLFADQIAYIVNHAEDRIILCDIATLPVLAGIADRIPCVETVVVMTDREHMPAATLPQPMLCYENLIEASDDDFAWRAVDERAALALCYTSGTTGNPKGVLYSHRSTMLHALVVNGADAIGLTSGDTVLAVVPMFHANAWCLPYIAPMAGAKLVLPGTKLDGASVHELLETEGVTFTAAVPTVWLMLLQHLEKTGGRLTTLKRVTIGGSAVPRSMIETFEDRYGVEVVQGWGMTEMSPVGTVTRMKGSMGDLDRERILSLKARQGRPAFSVEMKVIDAAGRPLPRDGASFGHILVRGPGVAASYFKGEGGPILDSEGWFDTGDVGSLDEYGFMQITDRAKDVIKSGGEWISSIDLENIAVGHPAVAEAAVVGVAHPKWDERPLLVVVRKPGAALEAAELLDWLRPHIARWWMPDDVVFLDEIPHTATGKIQKTALRDRFRNHVLPTGS
ncbi:MAG: long-chain-fatty-acid--CoA ligase [Alphaproteobacteria bacterium]